MLGLLIIFFNSFIRLYYPSNYCPRYSENNDILSSPWLARCLATVAEIVFYQKEAYVLNILFWGGILGNLTILGETLCWFHLIFESERLGFYEDCIWTVLQIYVLMINRHIYHLNIVFSCYLIYMIFYHLPKIYERVILQECTHRIVIDECLHKSNQVPSDVRRWQYLSLSIKPMLYLWFMYINNEIYI